MKSILSMRAVRTGLGVVLASLASASVAVADDLAVWTFEVSIPSNAGPHAAEIGSGQASGFHNSGSVVYSNPVGNGSFESFSSNFWEAGDYYQFRTSTLGYQNITFGWDQTRSSTGPGVFDVEYSVDGVNFSTILDDYNIAVVTWSSGTYDPASTFAAVTLPVGADNQADLWVRLTAQVGGSATAGTNRVDNVGIRGDVIPEPASLALLAVGGLALIRRR